ncbi:YidC/Oxa1 family membrane protein insertase [bacterium]|nr:YidC/Oxa1 family membrane protein insertase [bacterium]
MIEFFSTLIMNLINFLVTVTGSYGWALVILAILIKVILYGPTKQQFESMKNMSKIQPQVQKIQELYKDNPQKLQEESMKLYRENNINPLGGCLPMLIQLPILWLIWRVIMNYQDIFERTYFLWIGTPLSYKYPDWFGKSLAGQDVFLLFIYGFSMYLTQKTTTVSSDPKMAAQQNSMGLFMTVFFTWMMFQWKMPCALIIYWLVFNLLSIVQQVMIMNDNKPKQQKTESETKIKAKGQRA